MFRLTEIDRPGEGIVLRVEGRVIGPWVSELRQACERALSDGKALVLDLKDLWFVDAAGLSLLCQLKARDVAVANCPLFIAEQIEEMCDASSEHSR